MIAHNVYFSLNDASEAAANSLVEACHKYLKDHPGVVYFAAGSVGEGFDRPVNDNDFEVALHVFFEDRAAHDAYQIAPEHLAFIEGNKANWKQVRVFDSEVTT